MSFAIKQHEVVALIGPNGAGKTSVFNCVCGFYHPQEGQILWQGQDITSFKPHQIARLGLAEPSKISNSLEP
ncbi:MAG: ATP-binding cassette domain-containing protein [Deinococcales bacterium]